jgi:hypothetical protein
MYKRNSVLSFLYFTAIALNTTNMFARTSTAKLYGADSKEVEIRFEDSFLIRAESLEQRLAGTFNLEAFSSKDQSTIAQAAKLQVLHLYGVFSYHEAPINFAYYSGAILESQYPKIIRIKEESGKWRVYYSYEDKAVFFKPLFNALENPNELRFYMPNEPNEIYAQSIPNPENVNAVTGYPLNPCTDENDQSDLGYWYYWSPSREGCLRQIKDHIHEVVASIVPTARTRLTYPEYSQLFSPKDGVLNMRVIYGQDLDYENPEDIGRKTFESEFRIFKSWKDSSNNARFVVKNDEPFYKRLESTNQNPPILLELHYSNTDTPAFDELARASLQSSDVMVFAGHSYEDYYFDLERLFESPQTALPKDQYQIFYFDACTTYSYFGDKYFDAKKSDTDSVGSKTLDLVTNAIGAPFLVDTTSGVDRESNTTVFTRSLLGWPSQGESLEKLQSWQQILKQISKNSGANYTSLTLVKGDEDNPKSYDETWVQTRP